MGLWVSANPGLRLLCAKSVGSDRDVNGGYFRLDNNASHLVGVVAPEAPRAEGARGARRAKKQAARIREAAQPPRPSLEEVLAFANSYVPEKLWDDFAAGLKEKYRRK